MITLHILQVEKAGPLDYQRAKDHVAEKKET